MTAASWRRSENAAKAEKNEKPSGYLPASLHHAASPGYLLRTSLMPCAHACLPPT